MFLLNKKIIFIFAFLYCSSCFSNITLEILPHQGDHSVIDAIRAAKHNLQITMYGFTDEKIARALIEQQKQGVDVQLLIEAAPYKANNENNRIIKQLKRANISIHYSGAKFSLTHQKTIIVDHQSAMILTGNFTYSGFYHQRNFIVTIDDKAVIEKLEQLFNADWNNKTLLLNNDSTSLVTSPENSAKALSTFIYDTQQQLEIYALELTDKRILHALIKKSAFVHIKIITDQSKQIFNKKTLCQHRIEIRQLSHLQQHAKALLRDYDQPNALAYIGSANLSYSSLSKNREVGVLFSDEAALSRLHVTFEKDWKASKFIC